MKYLLSTGKTTEKIERYILDLFKLNLLIFPGDIPGDKGIGFDFILTDTKKDELESVVNSRVSSLVNKINNQFKSGVSINLEKIEILDETHIRVSVSVNQESDNIEINIG